MNRSINTKTKKIILLMLNATLKRSESKRKASKYQKASVCRSTADGNSAKTPSFFSLVSAILFQQKLRHRKKIPVEEVASLTEGQKLLARKKISISLRQTQSLPLPPKQKASLPARMAHEVPLRKML